MSKYKKVTFFITLGLSFLILMGCIYGYYNYRYYMKWQTAIMLNELEKGGCTFEEDRQMDELGQKKEYYLHLSQAYGFLLVGVIVSGTFFAFAIDLIKRDKKV